MNTIDEKAFQAAIEAYESARSATPAVGEDDLSVMLGDYIQSCVQLDKPQSQQDFIKLATLAIHYVLRPYLTPKQPTDDEVERVAAAIFESDKTLDSLKYVHESNTERDIRHAKAAIAAMSPKQQDGGLVDKLEARRSIGTPQGHWNSCLDECIAIVQQHTAEQAMPLNEDAICHKLMQWMQEGEAQYDNPKAHKKAHPNTLHGYMQIIGWVKRDLRVVLDRATEQLKALSTGNKGV